MVVMPFARPMPRSESRTSIPSAKKTSIMMPIVTSGIMIGRYSKASNTRRPRKRKRSRARALSVPSTTEATVAMSATCSETVIEFVSWSLFQNSRYQSRVKPPHWPTMRSPLNEKMIKMAIGA